MADLRAIGRIGALAMAIALAGCGPAEERQEAAEMVLPVEVLTVQAEPLALSSELPGRIEPVRVAEVRARVAGIVVRKRFEEGADVKAGDLLFQIDPAPLKAAVSRAEGELARNRALVTEGALVGQGEATLMARIQQLDPIYADFTQTAAEALRLRDALKKGTLAAGDSQALTLRVEGTPYERQGALQFADVAVDRGTGQIALRGKFANPDGVLLPGMYVRVRTPQGIDNQAILVPQRAVHRSSDGSAQVMVVGADERAEARSVGTGVMQGSRWQITEGLEPGDRVIVGGLAAVQPGVKIVPKPDGAQAQAQSPAPQQ
ncbi:TPA: efflux RND transporter periplasmic adaptor subunit [Pseudomonas aeruginosa]|nr:efflux RND transporter periplasmic adaptor subunit [Pseudomonas aeruginosa]